MTRLITLLALALVLLAGCGGQATPAAPASQGALAPAAAAAAPNEVALEFVTALGSWDEATIRRIALPTELNQGRIAQGRGNWRGLTNRLGPQQSVEIGESNVYDDRAELVVRSLHEKGESGVQLTLVLQDGAWRAESWRSFLP